MILVCTLALISLSCSKKSVIKQDFTFQPKIDVISEEVKFNDIVEDYKYIKLETNIKCLIGKVNQLLIYKSRIFILTEEIYCFNLDGKFLFSINQKGKGPSEYIRIYNFSIDNDIIYLNTPQKILCFDYNTGEFLKNYKHDFGIMNMGCDGNKIYMDLLPNKPQTKNGRIFISNIYNLKSIKAIFFEKKYERNVQNQFIGYNKNFYFIDPFLNQVYKINDEQVENYIFFDFGDKNPTEAENATRLANRKISYTGYSKAQQLENVYETPDFVIANIILDKKFLVVLFDKNSNKSIAWNTYKGFKNEPYQIYINVAEAVYEDYFCKLVSAEFCNKQMIKSNVLLDPTHPEYIIIKLL